MSNLNYGNGGVTNNSAASGPNRGTMGGNVGNQAAPRAPAGYTGFATSNGVSAHNAGNQAAPCAPAGYTGFVAPNGVSAHNAGNQAAPSAPAGYTGFAAPNGGNAHNAGNQAVPRAQAGYTGFAAPNGVSAHNACNPAVPDSSNGTANGVTYVNNQNVAPAAQANTGFAIPNGVGAAQSNTTATANPQGKVILKPFTYNGDGGDDVVYNDLYFGPPVSTEATDANSTRPDLIKPSLQELGEILQYIPTSDKENRAKVCLCLGTAYDQDPAVHDLLRNWLNNQFFSELLFFHRKNPSAYQLDEVLLLAQKGGYQIPDKFLPWLQVASADNAQLELLTRLTSELNLTSFERQTQAEILTLGEEVLSYWLCASEDDKARLSFLTTNSNRFRFFHPDHQPIIEALLTYCQARQESESPYRPFNYSDFVSWVQMTQPDKVSVTAIEQICQCNHSTFSRVNVNVCMDQLYCKSGRLHTILAAKELIAKLQTTSDYDLCRKARFDFILASQGAEKETSLGVQGLADNSHETADTITDEKKRMQIWVPSGYKIIDDSIFGYHRGGITIFGGSSGTGKTWFGLDATFKLIEKYKQRALFFSTEMDVCSIALRYFGLATNSKIGVSNLCYAKKHGELPKMEEAFRKFTQRHFSYDASSDPDMPLNLHGQSNLKEDLRIYGTEVGLTLSKLVNLITEESAKAPLDLVVIDYLQNIENDLVPPDTQRYTKLKHMVDVLKKVAQDCNCAILLLAQLTNPASWGKRAGRDVPAVPTSKDIAECSYAIHVAAAVLMMYKVSDSGEYSYSSPSFQQHSPSNSTATPASYDLTDEEIFDTVVHQHKVPLRLIITKARFGSSDLQLDSPIYVERSTGSRFNFYL